MGGWRAVELENEGELKGADEEDERRTEETRERMITESPGWKTYHSPLAVPSPLREESWVLPAAAEAKLEGSGVGIMASRTGSKEEFPSSEDAIRRKKLCRRENEEGEGFFCGR